MLHSLLLALLIAADAPADAAGAGRYDSNDPVQCLTIFALTASGGTQDGRSDLTEEMTALTEKLAAKHGGKPWVEKVQPQADAFAQQVEQDMDGPAMMKLLRECRAGLVEQ